MRTLYPGLVERIRDMLRDGISTRKISRKLQVSQTSVMNIRKAENLTHIKVKRGRPYIVSEEDARSMGRLLNMGKAKTPRQAAEMVGVSVSVWTVRRALKRVGCMISRTTNHRRNLKANNTAQLKPAKARPNMKADEWLMAFCSREAETSGTKSVKKSAKPKKLTIKARS